MQPTDARRTAQRPVDMRALQRIATRLHRAPAAPWLHGEVARRMVERLPLIKLQPQVLIDWWAHLGAGSALLRRSYPAAQMVCVEPDPVRRAQATATADAPWWSARRWTTPTPAVCASPLPAAAQLVWANMGLHLVGDPQAEMRHWQQALAVDGFVMFATLGPGTLDGLRACYRAAGWPAPHAPFVDMHDLGDMLLEAGFADPVMDQEQIVLSWPDAAAARAELRSLGGNADPARCAGLRTPRWRARLDATLQATAGADGRPRLAFEVVYGHAFKPLPRTPQGSETAVLLDDMRAMLRRPRHAL